MDFTDASTYYKVSTVNYLAAGSCNFNDSGVSLWPLNQIVNDTQYYVRDAVIDYATQKGIIEPKIEGRLQFIYDTTPPTITISSPTATDYTHPSFLKLGFSAVDVGPAGLYKVWADLDGVPVTNGQKIDLFTLALGPHTLTVYAIDKASNQSSLPVTFNVIATPQSLMTGLTRFFWEGKIDNQGVFKSLYIMLEHAQKALIRGLPKVAINYYNAFINRGSGAERQAHHARGCRNPDRRRSVGHQYVANQPKRGVGCSAPGLSGRGLSAIDQVSR